MNIIVCGMDCTGKTSVVERLVEKLNYEVRKGSSFEMVAGKTNDEILNSILDLIYDDNVIFDRFSYCNYTYAPLYNDYAVLTEEQIRYIERELKGSAIIVYLTASNETIKQRFETRGEDYVTPDKITSIKLGYEKVLADAELPVYTYITDIIDVESIVEDILDIIK